jgi:hypothetical protein
MTWPIIVLLLAATGLATAGAVVARGGRQNPTVEAGVRRAIVALGLLAAAAALAAVGGAMLGAGGTGPMQIGAFAGASATVAVPLLAVGLARRLR